MLPQLTTKIKKSPDVAKLEQIQTNSQVDAHNLCKILCETNKKDKLVAKTI